MAEAERIVGGFGRPESGILLVLAVTQVLGLQDATEAVVGPLAAPNSGIILALPVVGVRGMVRREPLPGRS